MCGGGIHCANITSTGLRDKFDEFESLGSVVSANGSDNGVHNSNSEMKSERLGFE